MQPVLQTVYVSAKILRVLQEISINIIVIKCVAKTKLLGKNSPSQTPTVQNVFRMRWENGSVAITLGLHINLGGYSGIFPEVKLLKNILNYENVNYRE